MGVGVGLFLFAAGAILTFAVEKTVSGIDLQTVGVILMVVGGLGVVLSLLFWSGGTPLRRRTTVYEDGPRGRRVYEERGDIL